MDIRTIRLKEAFEKSGLTQTEVCEKANMNKGAFSSYLSGRYFPKQKSLEKLASVLNVSIKYLMGIETDHFNLEGLTNISYPAAYPIPILGTICCGDGVLCEESYDGEFFVDRSIRADFCLRVKGDSMVEAGIYDGDKAFIKKSYDYIDGKIYAVRIEDSCEAVLKKIAIQEKNIILYPCNSGLDYQPMFKQLEDVCIIGECIGTYHTVK